MDARSIGANITALRKKHGLTQLALAERLGVTDKAVSRWENGQGYPDISFFPRLADIFGVTIDSLMRGDKKGIAIAGNIVLDIVKNITEFPTPGMLTHITKTEPYAVGGCVSNVSIDLRRMDPSIPVTVYGRVGIDEYGRFIISVLQREGINTDKIVFSKERPTSYSDVMSMPSGERTFFHERGANAEFCPEDIDAGKLWCDIFHIGYLLLLDVFDMPDKEYGTKMARFLNTIQRAGIKTSIDMVSDVSMRYGEIVIPALKYADYVIINEIECATAWNLEPRHPDGTLNEENIILAMQKCIDAGVGERVIVHAKERAYIMNTKKECTSVNSLNIPKESIKGSVGAGDAFCAGCLYALYNGYSDREILEFASMSAACNLFGADSISGMRSKNEILQLAQKYERL
ncbi:MAG: helix-turn-helix domain-containing protein [Clostridia bacterium]|nr:helix-turn-helix domain-containing protein [Clostridia bacterium]